MKKIWREIVELAEGWDETFRVLKVAAWWCKRTGTLRIELDVLDTYPGMECPVEVATSTEFGTFETREDATREVIACIDAAIAQHSPEAKRVAVLSIERKRRLYELA